MSEQVGGSIEGGLKPALLFAGAVLAGGESRRMGEDKARLLFGGEPLWRRQMRVLTAAGAAPVGVVRRAGQPEIAPEVRHVRDEFSGAGPLAGLHAALKASGAAWVAVLAVDMPAIEAAWFRGLWTQCAAGRGAVAQHADGFEPLAAIYPREALGVVAARLEAGRFSLQETIAELVAAERMAVRRLSEEERAQVENWNSPGDRRMAGERGAHFPYKKS
jgi:molybdopterin-guanine dinucleotide biosynthesis protein A